MKAFFNHAKGFLNIDDENFYFTTNGVWSYALSLEEESDVLVKPTEHKWTFKNVLIAFFACTIYYVIILFYMHQFTKHCVSYLLEAKFSLLNIFIICIFSYLLIFFLFAYKYFFSSKEPLPVAIEEKVFKIPKHNIQKIFTEDDMVYIIFTNKEGTLKSILLEQFAYKGIYSKSFFENM